MEKLTVKFSFLLSDQITALRDANVVNITCNLFLENTKM